MNSEPKLVILTTSFNCEKYIEKCLYSIMAQNVENFVCYITDDLSTDNTTEKVKEVIKNDNRFKLIINEKKLYQPGNYDNVIRNDSEISDDDICVEVDGDDWLPDNKVFERVRNTYNSKNVWMANGSFIYHDRRPGFAKEITDIENIRNQVFTLTHLRTWRVFLWRNIEQNDLKDDNGEYYKVAGDLSFMYPMIEMSGLERYRFMKEINYVYNESNPLNDHKVNMNDVNNIVRKIRNKKRYKLL